MLKSGSGARPTQTVASTHQSMPPLLGLLAHLCHPSLLTQPNPAFYTRTRAPPPLRADPFCFAVTYDKRVVAGPPRVDVRGSFRKAVDKPVFADIPLIRSPVVEVEVDASEDPNVRP